MKRRRFLQTLGAIAASSAVPLPSSPLTSFRSIGDAVRIWARGLAAAARPPVQIFDDYVVVMHPQQQLDLERAAARWRWYEAWHRYRAARRHGVVEDSWTPREILDWFGDAPQWEQGTIEGMRLARENHLRINKILGL